MEGGCQREELRPWQRWWGRRLGICKGVIKPQETPCSQASTPKLESVLCSHLHFWLYGGLSPITVPLGEGVNVQLQGNKNSWAWQDCFSLQTALKVLARLYRFVQPHVIVYSLPTWEARDVLDLLKANSFGELEIISIVGWLGIILVNGFSFVVSIIAANSLLWVGQGCFRSNLSADRLACVTGLSKFLPLCTWLFTTS